MTEDHLPSIVFTEPSRASYNLATTDGERAGELTTAHSLPTVFLCLWLSSFLAIWVRDRAASPLPNLFEE